jgi:hypothetical protein
MDNVAVPQDDFVTDHRSVKRRKTPSTIYFNGHFCHHSEEEITFDHGVLVALRRNAGDVREQKLADLCSADMHSDSWRASLERLSSRGYLVSIQREWDGVKCQWVELTDHEKKVKLLANGQFFAHQTLAQLMAER